MSPLAVTSLTWVMDARGPGVIECARRQPVGGFVLKVNVGGIDRIVRILAGLALIAWALLGGPLWAWVGLVPLATGLFRFCPVYPLLGISTCPMQKK